MLSWLKGSFLLLSRMPELTGPKSEAMRGRGKVGCIQLSPHRARLRKEQ